MRKRSAVLVLALFGSAGAAWAQDPEQEPLEALEEEATVLDPAEEGVVRIPLHEEQVEVVPQEEDVGALRIEKNVAVEQREFTVPLQTWVVELGSVEVQAPREPVATGEAVPGPGEPFARESWIMPITEEAPQIQKRVVVREELVLRARPITEQEQVQTTVRSETARVTATGDIDVNEVEPEALGIGGAAEEGTPGTVLPPVPELREEGVLDENEEE